MYACTADVRTGARCRELVPWPQTLCSSHQGVGQTAPMPDIVRVCLSLQRPEWSRALQREGIPLGQAKDRGEQARRIEAHAQQFGHNPHAYRQDFVDSGTLVLCTFDQGVLDSVNLARGLRNVSLWEAFRELLEAYSLGRVFIEPRQNKTDRLIIPFYKELTGQPVPQEVSAEGMMRLLEEFVSSWSVHIYANPPRPDGKIVHTVNAHGRQEKAAVTLRFNRGLWAVKEPA